MPEIVKYVDKSCKGFSSRINITWDDGAVTTISRKGIELCGRDGKKYKIAPGSEHAIACKEVLNRG